jgi:hypothetical protein
MHSTSLTLLSSLHVKGLTQRCYVWSDQDYKLALTLLNFQGGTKPPTTTTHGPHLQLVQATSGLGCYITRFLVYWIGCKDRLRQRQHEDQVINTSSKTKSCF